MAKTFNDLRKDVEDRIWCQTEDAFAFLVDQPHTFGHSQLIMRTPESEDEDCSFLGAVPHIAKCIKRLRTALPSPDAGGWKTLADYTQTWGRYEKTLVLRVSANEARGWYKVHLMPYYRSHLDATIKLYRATHNYKKKEDPTRKGGLLHWLGQREVLLDYDMRKGREDAIVNERINSFHLDKLADKLRGRTRARPNKSIQRTRARGPRR